MVCVYSKRSSSRLTYVLDYIFKHRCKIAYTYTSDFNQFKSHFGAKIKYASDPQTDGSLHVPQAEFLFKKGSGVIEPSTIIESDLVKLFHFDQQDTSNIDFDVFSSIFYCLSRYEEYTSIGDDILGRQTGTCSHSYKNGYLDRPVVDEWINYILDKLKSKFHNIEHKPDDTYQVELTVDIDRAYAYSNRSTLANALGSAKNLIQGDVTTIQKRWNTIKNKDQDPYDTYDVFEKMAKEQAITWFFLMKNQRPYDTAIGLENGSLEQLIKGLSACYQTGIHPSVSCHNNLDLLRQEKNLLESFASKDITKSRQHYLNLHFPETYQSLINIGITDDYSMGYHDVLGFRAGTSFPFLWYDLSEECTTSLLIHPFQIMDVTLKKYLKLTPSKAIEQCKVIINQIRKVKGTCSIIWHNSSFYELEGWKDWDTVLHYIVNSNE